MITKKETHIPVDLTFYILLAYSIYSLGNSAATKPFWTDEIFSWWVASRPTLMETLQLAYHGADGMLPGFYILSWFQIYLGAQSELALRIPPILIFLTGTTWLYYVLKKEVGPTSAAIGIGITCLLPTASTLLCAQFRGYGWLLGAIAASLATSILISKDPSKKNLILHSMTQVILVSFHPFGIPYCGMLGLATIGTGIARTKKINWKIIQTYIPAILVTIIWLPAILQAAQLNQPISWIPRPQIVDLPLGYLITNPQTTLPLGAGLLLLLTLTNRDPISKINKVNPIVISTAYALFSVPVIIWLLSQNFMSLFYTPYFSPIQFAWGLLLASSWARMEGELPQQTKQSVSTLLIAGVLLLTPPPAKQSEKEKALLQGTEDNYFLTVSGPIYCFDPYYFNQRFYYNPSEREYIIVTNEPTTEYKNQTSEKIFDRLKGNAIPKEAMITLEKFKEELSRDDAPQEISLMQGASFPKYQEVAQEATTIAQSLGYSKTLKGQDFIILSKTP